jgi:hypothetical protein
MSSWPWSFIAWEPQDALASWLWESYLAFRSVLQQAALCPSYGPLLLCLSELIGHPGFPSLMPRIHWLDSTPWIFQGGLHKDIVPVFGKRFFLVLTSQAFCVGMNKSSKPTMLLVHLTCKRPRFLWVPNSCERVHLGVRDLIWETEHFESWSLSLSFCVCVCVSLLRKKDQWPNWVIGMDKRLWGAL